MDLGSLIETHGYWVLALGCLLEGETILVLAGLAAERGYLHPFGVVVVARSRHSSATRPCSGWDAGAGRRCSRAGRRSRRRRAACTTSSTAITHR
jgi:hypothetical protein